MAILHHEMGFLGDALKYIRTALDIEKKEQLAREKELQKQIREAQHFSAGSNVFNYTANRSRTQITVSRFKENLSRPGLNTRYS
jgi:hypothetical protein